MSTDSKRRTLDGYRGSDSTVLVFTAHQESLAAWLSPLLLPLFAAVLGGVGSFMFVVFGLAVMGALVFFISQFIAWPVVFAVENDAFVFIRQRAFAAPTTVRVPFSEVKHVLRGNSLGAHSDVYIDVGKRRPIELAFLTRGKNPRPVYELVVNRSDTTFPARSTDIYGTVESLGSVLETLGVRVLVEHLPTYPRVRYWE